MTRKAMAQQVREAVIERNLKDLMFFGGGGLISWGLWTFSPGIALIFAGFFLILVSFSVPERPR